MKKSLFALALLLCLSLCVLVFSSCGNDGETTDATTAPETADRGTEDPETVPTDKSPKQAVFDVKKRNRETGAKIENR